MPDLDLEAMEAKERAVRSKAERMSVEEVLRTGIQLQHIPFLGAGPAVQPLASLSATTAATGIASFNPNDVNRS